jgi:predicted metal-dependent phosphoesterase TrpH
MLKVELHAHTSDDPNDRIPHSATELIDRAVSLGYCGLAITLHDRQLDIRPLVPYAAERGLTLIPGIERTVEGRHVLLINFENGVEEVRTFDDIARLKRRGSGLVIAPHPFFPALSCLRGMMDVHADLFDAVEYNAMFTPALNFNRRAVRWAQRHGRPMVGNCDVHRLHQLGTTYSLVDAEPDAAAICAAIASGRVRIEHQALGLITAMRTMGELLLDEAGHLFRR